MVVVVEREGPSDGGVALRCGMICLRASQAHEERSDK